MEKYLTQKKWIIIVATVCSVLWGSAFPMLKISYEEMMIVDNTSAKILLAGVRFLIASSFIFIMIKFIIKEPLKVKKDMMKKIFILGMFQTAILNSFYYIGLSNTTGMKGAIFSSVENFIVILLAHFIYKNDKINYRKIIGLALGFIGIVFANWGKGFEFDFKVTGEGFILIFTLSGAIATMISKKISESLNPFVINAYQMLMGAIVLLTLGIFLKGYEGMVITPKAIIVLIYLCFVSAITFSLWYALLKYNKAGEVTMYRFIIPVSGVMLSSILLPNESINIYILVSLLCVALGVFIVNKTTKGILLEEK